MGSEERQCIENEGYMMWTGTPLQCQGKAAATRAIFCLRWRCDFFGKLSRRRRAAVATLGNEVRDFVVKNSTHRISRDFFLRFLSCCIACARVATHAISAKRWRRDNFPKHRITIASKKTLV